MKKNISSENKKNITMFFCDIYGTVDGGFTEEECRKFAKLLKKVKEQNDSDYLIFGMLSTEHSDIVDSYEKRLSKYFDNNVLTMPKFPNAEALKEAKISCALYYIEQLKKKYNINDVFFADDTDFLQEMFKEMLEKMEGISLNSIIHKKGENNLNFINSELEERFIKQKKSREK